MLFDFNIMLFNEFICHGKTNKTDRTLILLVKAFPPVIGNIGTFHNELLMILNRCFDHLTDNWPQIIGKGLIVFRSKGCVATANQAHFQMINGQIRKVVFFQHPLCQEGFPGV